MAYEAGDRLMNTGAMLSYVKEEDYTITIDVSEEDISYINVGDTVDIEFNAYPDELCSGIVSAVTTTADSSYSSTVNYPVTIRIEGDTGKLYGGMTADITFVTDRAEDVLYVSAKAIVTKEDGSTCVYIKNAEGEMELKTVTTGFSNGSETEITDGLSEGDTVYIASTVSAGQSEESLKQTGGSRPEQGTGENAGDGEEVIPEGMGDFQGGPGEMNLDFPGMP